MTSIVFPEILQNRNLTIAEKERTEDSSDTTLRQAELAVVKADKSD